jgi:hypothetical protein
MRFHRSECERPAAEESPRRNQIPGWGRQENGWSIRRRGEIPCRRYAGRPGVGRNWPKSCAAQGTRSALVRLRTGCKTKTTASQATRKTGEGSSPPDRDAQFQHLHEQAFQPRGAPVVSVDAKKKEWVAIIRTEAVNGRPKAVRRKYQCAISRTRRRARRPGRESTGQEGWVRKEPIPTRRSLRCRRSAAGGVRGDRKRIRRRGSC